MAKIKTHQEKQFKQDFSESVAFGDVVCEICDLPKLVHPHRIRPGKYGGRYENMNVAPLCPTHHFAVHFLINWFMRDKERLADADQLLLDHLKADARMWKFWKEVQWPICMELKIGKKPFVPETT